MKWLSTLLVLLLAACSPERPAADPGLASEIDHIPAIDNHAHPVRYIPAGQPADRFFDALPVDHMEPQSDPVNLRPGTPAIAEAAGALYGGADKARKQRAIDERRDTYPTWVLDQAGVETMLANRVEMGASIQPPRFRWVPYADALMYPLPTTTLAARNPDRKAFFALEDIVLKRYLAGAGVPRTLDEYLKTVVTPTLEHHKQGGAVAEKFEAAYLRSLSFDKVDRATADRIYTRGGALSEADYKPLQDFLFRYIAGECGRLGMAVHIHTNAGAGGYFDVAGANPLNLESVLDDPELRKTNFVMLHGGWPFVREIGALLTKPNAYLDFSAQSLALTPATLAATLREWLEYVPEKVMFATDAYPYSEEMGWEESLFAASRAGREALAIALTGMVRDHEITRTRASELAHMVLHNNAAKLYHFQP